MSHRLVSSQLESVSYERTGKSDGTWGDPFVRCEMNYVRVKPCDVKIPLDVNHQPINAVMTFTSYSRAVRAFCSWKCAARYARTYGKE